MKVESALASTILRVSWLVSESRECLGKHILESEVDLRVKELRPLGGHEHGDTGTSSSSPDMEHPEAAVEVEVKASLGEVLSRWQQR